MSNWPPSLKERSGPRYLALAEALCEAVDRGELRPGTRLPSRRDLAYDLGLSVNTVAGAYLEAERRGYVSGEVGRGTYILSRRRDTEAFLGGRPSGQIDLSICRPCQLPLQERLLTETFAELAADGDMSSMLVCRPINGMIGHRMTAAGWLERLGMPADPDDIILTNGCVHGLLVTLAALTEPGTVVATESLTDHGIISLASVLHFRLIGLETDAHGLVPGALDVACRQQQVRILVVTPTLTNPTCQVMPAERRAEVVEVARRHDVAIVEDDVFGALVEDRPPPLASLAPERGYYVTSFTKCAISGLRTGYLVAPRKNIQRLITRVRTTSWMATPLVAEIATRWILDGRMEAIVEAQREEIRRRQAIVAKLLRGHRVAAHREGLNVWLDLPEPWRAPNFVAAARDRGVALSSAEPFEVGRGAAHAVRLSVGAASDAAELTQGLEIVRALLNRPPEPQFLDF